MLRALLHLRLGYARLQRARAAARAAELAALVAGHEAAGETMLALVRRRALDVANRDAAAWHFEAEVLAEELAQPGPVRRALARGARWCASLERGNARLWEGRANALGATSPTSSADARERAYEHHSDADSWEVTAARLEGTAPRARGIDA